MTISSLIEIIDAADTVHLTIPSQALDKLIEFCEFHETVVTELGISFVSEILDKSYNLTNIRKLFSKGFKLESLRAFVNNYYPELTQLLSLQQYQLLDELLKHTMKEEFNF